MSVLVQQFIIFGVTNEGKPFRPSDWAERLAGVMSSFRPPGSTGGHLTYSPYVVPMVIDGIRCVVVDHRLRELEPLAWNFVYEFAQDNHLKTAEKQIQDRSRPVT
ncbi:DUF3579 domain-containing protein [Eoetvoesiella caeni]|uniref:Uncharacterized protein DUF3579 n=1 Tax=Eoetvoesiella caeni TaxID=645616 RepID=A0A366HFJ3_9BURK|nr:DUF3579 domain-containing protein [Eoetvoesiella caeni]MCI2808586.1 DUF3579 domain-containing protein [Eoetvoesiella caeni]NYT55126.1 DUF3579 domain-containing protein [Eoetvoesiella caeni]RBP40894.1 uncharacterized protein DUF3579 [Eoetvoesiella caeni]